MRALSFDTHYAYLIALGYKDIENRSYNTQLGELLIHSTKKYKTDCITQYFPENSKIKKLWDMMLDKKFNPSDGEFKKLENEYSKEIEIIKKDESMIYHNSAIIGCVTVQECKQSDSEWAIEGQKHWKLINPVLFDEPLKNVVGRQGIFNIELPKSYDKYFV